MDLFTLSSKLTIDTRDFDLKISLAEDKARKIGEEITVSLGDSVKGIPSALGPSAETSGESLAQSFAKGIIRADIIGNLIRGGAQFIEQGITTASSLKEVQNVIDTAFGSSAEAANEWAENAKQNYGMSELTAKQYLGRFRQMWESTEGITAEQADKMSMTMTGLVGDFSSFYDSSFEQSYTRIKAIVTGETEAIEEWGISLHSATLQEYALSHGIETAYKNMTEAEKRQLRYNYVLEQSENIQGDFLKTQDSYANQMRLFQENMKELGGDLGGGLLPMLSGALQLVNGLFAPPQKDQLSKEIEKTNDQAQKFSQTMSQAEESYNNQITDAAQRLELAQKYLETMEHFEGFKNLTPEETEQLENAVTALTTLYPQLSELVNSETGFFETNTQNIRENIKALNDLSLAKAQQYIQREYEQRYGEATAGYVSASRTQGKAEEELSQAQQRLENIEQLQAHIRDNGGFAQQEYNATTGLLLQSIEGMEQYYNFLQDGSAVIKNEFKTVASFLGPNGIYTNVAADIGQLIYNAWQGAQEGVENATENYDTATSAVEIYKAALEQMVVEYQGDIEALKQIQQETIQTLEATPDASGTTGAAEEIKETLESAGGTADTVKTKIDEALSTSPSTSGISGAASNVINSFQSIIEKAEETRNSLLGVFSPGSTGMPHFGGSGGRFATGLEYVPYNDFPAYLHRGEMVLTAEDATNYRAQRSGGKTGKDGITVIQNIQAVPMTATQFEFEVKNALDMLRLGI